MAFKKIAVSTQVPDSPEKLFRDLSRRNVPDVLPHQGAIMRDYAQKALLAKDVALQLPTGSGKTLVGLLIGEWRRRKNHERVVYLCPTKQLVNQVVSQANDSYGLSVVGFTGQVRDYSPSDKTLYATGERLAVTTYNSLFNTNPFFADADVIIVDDAHAAEAYVASNWSLRVERRKPQHANLHAALVSVLSRFLPPSDVVRLAGYADELSDSFWVDKLPTAALGQIADELIPILDEHTSQSSLKYPWLLLRDHLLACQVYMSSTEILVRPLIPPTWSHEPFEQAKQRIYMSATLGESGDLERLLGRRDIMRLPVPDGWDKQGVGRRFFMLPEVSLAANETLSLELELIKTAKRAVVLVPTDRDQDRVATAIQTILGYPVFNASDIEASKTAFIKETEAVAVISNRYDGIDFPKEECRLLVVEGLPKVLNLQERFLMSRMGANLIFRERVQTRVVQAIGRCTRSLEDYSAVVVMGSDLTDYFLDPRRRKYFHPELQAELEFGVQQSKDANVKDFVENLNTFLYDRETWEGVEREIIDLRHSSEQATFPAMSELRSVVKHEVKFQEALWSGDHEAASAHADSVLGGLMSVEVKGYRALWHYLNGSACEASTNTSTQRSMRLKAKDQFKAAKAAAAAVPWLVRLVNSTEGAGETPVALDPLVVTQIENIESHLANLGIKHDMKYTKLEREILDGTAGAESTAFETAQKKLGDLLGFTAGKVESEGAPDPWWLLDKLCVVFEDHSDAEPTSALAVTKARQAASHPAWIKAQVPAAIHSDVIPVLVTPVKRVSPGVPPHLQHVTVWPLDDYRLWVRQALTTIRNLRTTFSEPGDLGWREQAYASLQTAKIDAPTLFSVLKAKGNAALMK